MLIDIYPKEPPVVMNLVNNYISDSVYNRSFRDTTGKDQMGVALTHTQYKDNNDKKQIARGGPISSTDEKNITGKQNAVNRKNISVDNYMPILGPRKRNNINMEASQE